MTDVYPITPGAKGPDGTSPAEAKDMARSVSHLRRVAIRALLEMGEGTGLEAVSATKLPRENLQPRFSELRAMGLVEPTGARRRNPSGKSAAVLRLTDKGREALANG